MIETVLIAVGVWWTAVALAILAWCGALWFVERGPRRRERARRREIAALEAAWSVEETYWRRRHPDNYWPGKR